MEDIGARNRHRNRVTYHILLRQMVLSVGVGIGVWITLMGEEVWRILKLGRVHVSSRIPPVKVLILREIVGIECWLHGGVATFIIISLSLLGVKSRLPLH